jgi:hypothetical protein
VEVTKAIMAEDGHDAKIPCSVGADVFELVRLPCFLGSPDSLKQKAYRGQSGLVVKGNVGVQPQDLVTTWSACAWDAEVTVRNLANDKRGQKKHGWNRCEAKELQGQVVLPVVCWERLVDGDGLDSERCGGCCGRGKVYVWVTATRSSGQGWSSHGRHKHRSSRLASRCD